MRRSGDLYNLLEILKEPLSPASAVPNGASTPGRISSFSPRRWWDTEGGAEAYPEGSYVALRSTRRGTPIEVFWSLGSATSWTVFKLRWEAATGLALPDDPSTPPTEPAPPLPASEPYDAQRPLLGYTPLLSPTAGVHDVPVCVSTTEPEPYTAELHRLYSWETGVGMDTEAVPCAALDGVSFAAEHQPMRAGSYARIDATAGSFPSATAPSFTVAVYAWPTAPEKMAPQVIHTRLPKSHMDHGSAPHL